MLFRSGAVVVDHEPDETVEGLGVLVAGCHRRVGHEFGRYPTDSLRSVGAGTWESHHAITTLCFRYAEAMDAADYDALTELFADAELSNEGFAGSIRGGAAITDLYRRTNRVHPDGTLRTRHLTTNLIIDIDEATDAAGARSAFVVLQQTPALEIGRAHV